MTSQEKTQKRIEIFGEEYPEHVFVDIDSADNQVLADICCYAQKGYDILTIEDVLNYIKDMKPEVYKAFAKCWVIARDAVAHGRLWLPDNPLAMLMKREDISVYERTAMYGFLLSTLELDFEEEEK